jgi:hypothetical protein
MTIDDNWMAFREYRFEEKKTDLRRRNQNVVSLWKLFLGKFFLNFFLLSKPLGAKNLGPSAPIHIIAKRLPPVQRFN